jgi:Fe-S-cluster containining protein
MPHEPITDLVYIQLDSTAKEQENLAFRGFVKHDLALSDRRLNAVVQETTEHVWSYIDCRTCGNCCKTQQPVFSRTEAQRIATYLGLTLKDLVAQYLTSDADVGKYITRQLPCPFLENNLCTIYPVRPAVCRNYPHLHRNVRSRLWQLLDNASVCPIVYNVLESLKTQFGFQHLTPETE